MATYRISLLMPALISMTESTNINRKIKFAAAVVICGGIVPPPPLPAPTDLGDPYARAAAKVGSAVPLWVFHGDTDPVVPVTESRKIVDADRVLLNDFLSQQTGVSTARTEFGTTSFLRFKNGDTEPFLQRLRD